jgi:hypothetical protein
LALRRGPSDGFFLPDLEKPGLCVKVAWLTSTFATDFEICAPPLAMGMPQGAGVNQTTNSFHWTH